MAQAEKTSAAKPLDYAVERLCRFHGTHFDSLSALREDRSPLAWPDVFEGDIPNAKRQRIEARALLDANGLIYTELLPLDLTARTLADSLATSISRGHPVLINAPQAPVVFGYDRRERDHWWWFDLAGTPEIALESERSARFTMWSDDPESGIAWTVTGVGDFHPRDRDSLDWAFLTRLNGSVQGVPEDGITPFPLSLRRLRDILASADSLPLSDAAIASSDPLGVMRARAARSGVIGILQPIIARTNDTSVSNPLRLVEFHLHRSVAALNQMAEVVDEKTLAAGGPITGPVALKSLQDRTHALQSVNELLKSDRLAMESLSISVAAYDAKREKPVPPRQNRRRR